MPVYTHLDVGYSALRLGTRIREERKKHGWTLQELASRLAVSTGRLSAIENEKLALHVDLLLSISRALGVPFETLLPRSGAHHFHIARRHAIEAQPALPIKLVNLASQKLTSYHNRLWPLADAFVGKYIEPLEIEVRPSRDDELHFISHTHEEFFFVLRGEVECLIKTPDELVRERLGSGDCMYFWSYLPHCIRSTTDEPARIVDLLCSLHEAADSEYATSKSGPMVYLMDASHKNLTEHIAGKIASLRRTRGMSVAEFAGEIGISFRRLTRIERGQSPIPLDLLLHICQTFRKPREYFLAGTAIERPFHHVLRAKAIHRQPGHPRPRLPNFSNCCAAPTFKPLADGFPNRGMQPYLIRLDPTHTRTARLTQHAGQEFVYVLSGAVRLVMDENGERMVETLFPGDSCFMESSAPHRFVEARFNPYEKSGAEMIAVFWHPHDAGLPGGAWPSAS